MAEDHLHIYNLRGFCWCGVHRDDWLRNEDLREKIGEAFKHLNRADSLAPAKEKQG